MFGPLGWSSGPAKLVGWPLQLKSGTAAVFTCQLCLKNKTQRQSHLTLGYFLVQYHFALHPPFKGKQNPRQSSFLILYLCAKPKAKRRQNRDTTVILDKMCLCLHILGLARMCVVVKIGYVCFALIVGCVFILFCYIFHLLRKCVVKSCSLIREIF